MYANSRSVATPRKDYISPNDVLYKRHAQAALIGIMSADLAEAAQTDAELQHFDSNLKDWETARPRLQTSSRRGVPWAAPITAVDHIMRVPTSEVRPGDKPFKPRPLRTSAATVA